MKFQWSYFTLPIDVNESLNSLQITIAAAEGEVPGPLTDWKPQVSTDERRMKLEDFPKTLYPPVHLDTRNNSKELWDNSRKGYPQIENVYLVSTENYGASGNCYFNASMKTDAVPLA